MSVLASQITSLAEQATSITWTNVGPLHWRIYAALWVAELTQWDLNEMSEILRKTFSNYACFQNALYSIKSTKKTVPKSPTDNFSALV